MLLCALLSWQVVISASKKSLVLTDYSFLLLPVVSVMSWQPAWQRPQGTGTGRSGWVAPFHSWGCTIHCKISIVTGVWITYVRCVRRGEQWRDFLLSDWSWTWCLREVFLQDKWKIHTHILQSESRQRWHCTVARAGADVPLTWRHSCNGCQCTKTSSE